MSQTHALERAPRALSDYFLLRERKLVPTWYTERKACQHGYEPEELPHLGVIHTGENLTDFVGSDQAAERLANYAKNVKDRKVSWHDTVDSDSIIPMLPGKYTAFHVRYYNRCAVGVEVGMKSKDWGRARRAHPAWVTGTLNNLVEVVGGWCLDFDLEPKLLVGSEVSNRGITYHRFLDASRRSDPGLDFPEDRFFKMLRTWIAEQTASVGIVAGTKAEKRLFAALDRAGFTEAYSKNPMTRIKAFQRWQGLSPSGEFDIWTVTFLQPWLLPKNAPANTRLKTVEAHLGLNQGN